MPDVPLTVDDLVPAEAPPPEPQCTPQQILFGPPIDPIERIKGYSADMFEAFIGEWAFYYLQGILTEYVQVSRFGGSGDKGRDIVAYVDTPAKICDVFQCKHYDHALYPSDLWLELAKLCYYTHATIIPIPRRFRFVAPQNVGSSAGLLLENPNELKAQLIEEWLKDGSDSIRAKLVKGRTIALQGDLRAYVDAFDFAIVGFKPIEEVVAEHRKTIRHAPRFGGGLTKPLPPDQVPPADFALHETVYVTKLLDAYRDNLHDPVVDFTGLTAHAKLQSHYQRSRERFYCAETLREFARDALPEGTTFRAIQDQVYDRVIDTAERVFPCGYTRVVAVTDVAASTHVVNHPLGTYLQTKSLQGICHQLANDDRLTWVPHA